jgi:cyclic-di-GMP-binding protein
MPSFDIVSKVALNEVTNAIDQANREVATRFDFKDSGARFEYVKDTITLIAQNKFQLEQMATILNNKLTKRGIDITCMEYKEHRESLHEARQDATIHQGIEQEIAKKIVKMIKDSKLKVQASIMGEHIRITGKKRDDLQDAIGLLRKGEFGIPLQYENFRD